MSTLRTTGLRIAGAGTAAAALTLAAAAPALAQGPISDVDFYLGIQAPYGYDGVVETTTDSGFGPEVHLTDTSETAESYTIETVLDLSAAAGLIDFQVTDERCETNGLVVTCTDADLSIRDIDLWNYSGYEYELTLLDGVSAGDLLPYTATISVNGEVVTIAEDSIKVDEEYGSWVYDPSEEYTTDHNKNDYDLSVHGADIEGDLGDVVTVDITVQNLGPLDAVAPIHRGAGEGNYSVIVQLPSGTAPVPPEDEDFVFSENGVYCELLTDHQSDLSHAFPANTGIERQDILCFFDSVAMETGARLQFPVEIIAEEQSADGLIAVIETMELDADYANNIASLSLQSGGSDGEASEQLPSTGNSSVIMISSAAAALLAGAVVFSLLRRRKTAANWE
ncbi:MAG TPA: LPXTG cell wall anchor domain-containing protein [Glycomyces sp.]|nr:LPXTG cell wall anchor domain-containing protein [Glycomyces sp.]